MLLTVTFPASEIAIKVTLSLALSLLVACRREFVTALERQNPPLLGTVIRIARPASLSY